MLKVIGILFIILVVVMIRKMIKINYVSKMTPTMRYILAVNATTDLHSFKTCIDVNGYRYNIFARLFANFVLKAGWGVKDKESAVDMIEWLFNEGHNTDFMKDLQSLDDEDWSGFKILIFRRIVKKRKMRNTYL